MALKQPQLDKSIPESQSKALLGGSYNYVDYSPSMLGGLKNSISRAIGSVNPFAIPQGSDQLYNGTSFYFD